MMMTSLFDIPLIGGLTLGLAATINVIILRYIFHYVRETREEYVRRLTQAVIELEYQKTENLRLELEIERMKILHGLTPAK